MSIKLNVWGLTTKVVEVELRINIFKCDLDVECLNLHHENASILECTDHEWYRYAKLNKVYNIDDITYNRTKPR